MVLDQLWHIVGSCWIKWRWMLWRGIQTCRLLRSQWWCCDPWLQRGHTSSSWRGGLDATMEISDGVETSVCDMLSRAIPTSIPTRSTKITVAICHALGGYLSCPVSCVEDGCPQANREAWPPVLPQVYGSDWGIESVGVDRSQSVWQKNSKP